MNKIWGTDHSQHQPSLTGPSLPLRWGQPEWLCPKRQQARAGGFSLIELMIAVVVGGAVLLSVGTVLMAQIELSRMAESSQQLRDNWSRLAQFIESEIILSERILTDPAVIITTAGSGNSCGYAQSDIKLALVGDDNASVTIYALQPVATGDDQWRGPNLLKRCGKLDSSGALVGAIRDQVLADGVVAFTPVITVETLNSLSSAGRNVTVDLSLTTATKSSNYTGRFGGQARVNPAYNFLNDYGNRGSLNLCAAAGILCGTGTLEFTTSNCAAKSACDLAYIHQYYPTTGTTTILGSSLHEDVIYLPGNRANYSLYGLSSSFPCTRQLCTVFSESLGTVTISQGDVLIFQDGDLRF
jgi:prepilin-type N-terminal cleavage/methylation domain-containing protein